MSAPTGLRIFISLGSPSPIVKQAPTAIFFVVALVLTILVPNISVLNAATMWTGALILAIGTVLAVVCGLVP